MQSLSKDTKMFTWTTLYQDLADKLLDWENRQSELVAFMSDLKNRGLTNLGVLDKDAHGNRFELTSVDPFTVFATFNRRISDDSRLAILGGWRELLASTAPMPKDFHGIPIVDNRQTWFFAYAAERQAGDIPALWRIFRIALKEDSLSNPEFESAFDTAVKVRLVKRRLSIGLYWIRPTEFLPLDEHTRDYLNVDVENDELNAQLYRSIIDKARSGFKASFTQISYDAWVRGRKPKPGDENPPKVPSNQPGEDLREDGHQRLHDLQLATGIPRLELERWLRALERKRQVIFYGPPGTGKTFVAQQIAHHLTGGTDGLHEVIQLHPAYAYEDFMQGLRPTTSEGGVLRYELAAGRFMDFCQRAVRAEAPCVLIIDEINRANLARVFGELMYLLEYRHESVPLAAGGPAFAIPANVRIIGTMNTADRSIALVDFALRRRFAFLKLAPSMDALRHYHRDNSNVNLVERLIRQVERLNEAINDPDYFVGVSYFMIDDLGGTLEDIWRLEIEPYLEEYFVGNREQVTPFTWTHMGPLLHAAE
jgi:5-methylcytosine-specific restriction protein B